MAVTGATGFIGSHVVERLLRAPEGTEVVAVVHSLPKLIRLAHLLDHTRLRYTSADIRDQHSLTEAFRGCDVVVHTVYGSTGEQKHRWSVTVEGTEVTLAAANRAGVRRLVNLSTMAVYEPAGRTVLDEKCPLRPVVPGDLSYAQQKLAAERLTTLTGNDSMENGPSLLEIVTVQPTIVYGPWGPMWTLNPLEQLGAGHDVLPSGSDYGACNAVHVHDVADAVVFLVGLPAADQLRLLVSGPEPVGWGTFYDAYRDLLAMPRPGRGDRPGLPPASDLYTSQVVVSTQRLSALGFHSRIGFVEGMAQVAAWARWAGLATPRTRKPSRAAWERPS
ncbi:MAG TPA: NAD(P)-dependent oxidoreductase [Pseudonocardiaceae bacterium]|nr:NAD(P)-dependent oxidoreductase [Pseudonocardiaceae bacterium]